MVLGTSLRYATLDVSTTQRFKGNPLAIVELSYDFSLDRHVNQRIAQEFNFSEAVLLHPCSFHLSPRKYDIFKTTEELPFAGHPTIGTLAHVGSGVGVTDHKLQALTLQAKAGVIKETYDSATRCAPNQHTPRCSNPSKYCIMGIRRQCPTLSKTGRGPVSAFMSNGFHCQGMTFALVNLPSVEDMAGLTVRGSPLDLATRGWTKAGSLSRHPISMSLYWTDKTQNIPKSALV